MGRAHLDPLQQVSSRRGLHLTSHTLQTQARSTVGERRNLSCLPRYSRASQNIPPRWTKGQNVKRSYMIQQVKNRACWRTERATWPLCAVILVYTWSSSDSYKRSEQNKNCFTPLEDAETGSGTPWVVCSTRTWEQRESNVLTHVKATKSPVFLGGTQRGSRHVKHKWCAWQVHLFRGRIFLLFWCHRTCAYYTDHHRNITSCRKNPREELRASHCGFLHINQSSARKERKGRKKEKD